MPELTIRIQDYVLSDLDTFQTLWGNPAPKFKTREEAGAWLVEVSLYRGKEAAILKELAPHWIYCLHGKCPLRDDTPELDEDGNPA